MRRADPRAAVRTVHPFRLIAALGVACVWVACRAPSDEETRRGPFAVRDAWARTADSGTTGGAYLTLTNRDTLPVTITGVTTTWATAASVHETMTMEGMTHMMPMSSMTLARDSTLTMRAGGVHLMLDGLTHALRVGDTVPVTLQLGDGRAVALQIPVRAP